jgi:small-conductance mechanosensitive channel
MKIQEQALHQLIDIEPFILISALLLAAWGFYKFLLQNISVERHQRIQKQFHYIFRIYSFFTAFFLAYLFLYKLGLKFEIFLRPSIYAGLTTFIVGSAVVVKTSRLILLQYLFLGSMKAGVPLLLVNIFSLLLSFAIALWGISHFLGVDLAPILATSAALSIVLGLALQDTLGNLFAGISMQMDHSFEIGDWVEVITGNQKTVGQVTEISWRATTLTGWFNETITLPNRFLASAQISNYRKGEIALYRSQTFRVSHFVDTEQVRRILLDSLRLVTGIRHDLPAACVVMENHDSWLAFRLSFAIDDYSRQFFVGHDVLTQGLQCLLQNGIKPSKQQVDLDLEKNPLEQTSLAQTSLEQKLPPITPMNSHT